MAILCSIIRLIPHMMTLRIHAYMSAVLFGLMWAALIIQKLVICETDTKWKNGPGYQCVLGPAVGGLELASTSFLLQSLLSSNMGFIADLIADAILVALPIRLLWRISLSPARRILLTGIFSASIFTTITSIVHGVYVFGDDRNAEGIWAHVLVCLPVSPLRISLTYLF